MNWVNDMNSLAASKGKVGTVKLVIVPKVGHSSRQLTPTCQKELFSNLE